jgi:hypothetical protein
MWVRGNCPRCDGPFKINGRGRCRLGGDRGCQTYLVHSHYARMIDVPTGTLVWHEGVGTDTEMSVIYILETDPVTGQLDWLEHWGSWFPLKTPVLERPDRRRIKVPL